MIRQNYLSYSDLKDNHTEYLRHLNNVKNKQLAYVIIGDGSEPPDWVMNYNEPPQPTVAGLQSNFLHY